MKKYIIISLLILSNCSLFSQIGVLGGLDLSSLRSKADNSKYMIGFHAGGFYDLHLFNNVYFHPQLLLSYQPSSVSYSSIHEGQPYKTEFNANGVFITAPIMLSYKIPIKKENKLGVDLGAYLSYGVSGKLKTNKQRGDDFNSSSEPLFSDNEEPLQAGLIGGLRYEFKNYLVSSHVKYGLNTVTVFEEKPIIIMASLGYKFK